MRELKRISKMYYLKQIVCCWMILSMSVVMPMRIAMAVPTPDAGTLPSGIIDSIGINTPVVDGLNMGITQTVGEAIVNWTNFDIGANAGVEFFQPGSGSAVLNRVHDGDMTGIMGSLTANGRVFIINPAGMMIGEGAVINVSQLVASGLNITDEDFMNGVYEFAGGNGAVSNYGHITAEQVALIGSKVLNAGLIQAPAGSVIMAAGDRVFLGYEGSNVVVEITGVDLSAATDAAFADGDVINEGTIEASGGQIVLAAGDTWSRAVDGIDGLTVATDGGTGRVGQFGTLNADGVDGDGGSITMTAGDVVVLGEDSVTTANAGTNGDGGEIIAYSPDTAILRNGALVQAKGGSESGDGGFVELSGLETVEAFGLVDTTASNGETGNFLIDPRNIKIVDAPGNPNQGWWDNPADTWRPNNYTSRLDIDWLEYALYFSNVTLNTGMPGGGGADGWIWFDASRDLVSARTWGSGWQNLPQGIPDSTTSNNNLTVKAWDGIVLDSGINFTGSGDVSLYARKDITINAGINLASGRLEMLAGQDDGRASGLTINESITAGSMYLKNGSITQTEATHSWIDVADGAKLTSTDGDIGIEAVHDIILGNGDNGVVVDAAGSLWINGDRQGNAGHGKGGDLVTNADMIAGGSVGLLANTISLGGNVSANGGSLFLTARTSKDDNIGTGGPDGTGSGVTPGSGWGGIDVANGKTLYASSNIQITDAQHLAANNSAGQMTLTGNGELTLHAGGEIVSPETLIKVNPSSPAYLTLHQGLDLNTASYMLGNQDNTHLTLISDAGSVTSTTGANAADEWRTIKATADDDIILRGNNDGPRDGIWTRELIAGKDGSGNIDIESVGGGKIHALENMTAGTDIILRSSTNVAPGKTLSAGDDVVLAEGKTLHGFGALTIKAGLDIMLGVNNQNAPLTGSAGNVSVAGNLTLVAGNDVYAHGTLNSDKGNVEISSSNNTTFLGDDVTAGVDYLGSITLHNNARAADGVLLKAGKDITAKGTLTGRGSLTLEADDKIFLEDDVVAAKFVAGNLKIIADHDRNWKGGVFADGSIETVKAGPAKGNILIVGRNVELGKQVKSARDLTIIARAGINDSPSNVTAQGHLGSFGNMTVKADNHITLSGQHPQFGSAKSGGDMILRANADGGSVGDMTAMDDLTSVHGDVDIYSSDDTTNLYGDVYADINDDGNITLHNNAWVADDAFLQAGQDITANGTLTGDGTLTLDAGNDIRLKKNVVSDGDMTMDAGDDITLNENGGDTTSHGDVMTLNAGGDVTAYNNLVTTGNYGAGNMTVNADNIYVGENAYSDGTMTMTATGDDESFTVATDAMNGSIKIEGHAESKYDMVMTAEGGNEFLTDDGLDLDLMNGSIEIGGDAISWLGSLTMTATGGSESLTNDETDVDLMDGSIKIGGDVTSLLSMNLSAKGGSEFLTTDGLDIDGMNGSIEIGGDARSWLGSMTMTAEGGSDIGTIDEYDIDDMNGSIKIGGHVKSKYDLNLSAKGGTEAFTSDDLDLDLMNGSIKIGGDAESWHGGVTMTAEGGSEFLAFDGFDLDLMNGSIFVGGHVWSKGDTTMTAVGGPTDYSLSSGDVTVNGDVTSYGKLDVDASGNIRLKSDIWSAGEMTMDAGNDIELNKNSGNTKSDSSMKLIAGKTNSGGDVEVWGKLKTTNASNGNMTVKAADDIKFYNSPVAADSAGEMKILAGLDNSGGDVEVWGKLKTTNADNGNMIVKAADDIRLYKSPVAAESAGEMKILAGLDNSGGNVEVEGKLKTTNADNGNMIVKATNNIDLNRTQISADSAGELKLIADSDDDQNGNLTIYGDIYGNMTLSGYDVTEYGDITSYGTLDVDADNNISLKKNVVSDGDMTMDAISGNITLNEDGGDTTSHGDVMTLNAGGNVTAHHNLTTTGDNGAGNMTVNADNIYVGENADSAGTMTMTATGDDEYIIATDAMNGSIKIEGHAESKYDMVMTAEGGNKSFALDLATNVMNGSISIGDYAESTEGKMTMSADGGDVSMTLEFSPDIVLMNGSISIGEYAESKSDMLMTATGGSESVDIYDVLDFDGMNGSINIGGNATSWLGSMTMTATGGSESKTNDLLDVDLMNGSIKIGGDVTSLWGVTMAAEGGSESETDDETDIDGMNGSIWIEGSVYSGSVTMTAKGGSESETDDETDIDGMNGSIWIEGSVYSGIVTMTAEGGSESETDSETDIALMNGSIKIGGGVISLFDIDLSATGGSESKTNDMFDFDGMNGSIEIGGDAISLLGSVTMTAEGGSEFGTNNETDIDGMNGSIKIGGDVKSMFNMNLSAKGGTEFGTLDKFDIDMMNGSIEIGGDAESRRGSVTMTAEGGTETFSPDLIDFDMMNGSIKIGGHVKSKYDLNLSAKGGTEFLTADGLDLDLMDGSIYVGDYVKSEKGSVTLTAEGSSEVLAIDGFDLDLMNGSIFVGGYVESQGDTTMTAVGGPSDYSLSSGDVTVNGHVESDGKLDVDASGNITLKSDIRSAGEMTMDAGSDITLNEDSGNTSSESTMALNAGDDITIGKPQSGEGNVTANGIMDIIAGNDSDDDIKIFGKLTTTNNGYINVRAGDDISIYGTFNGPVFESVEADGTLTMIADTSGSGDDGGDLYVLGSVEGNMYLSGDDVTVKGDVTSHGTLDVDADDNIWLTSNVSSVGEMTMDAGNNITLNDESGNTTSESTMALNAGDDITIGKPFSGEGNVTANGNMDIIAGGDSDDSVKAFGKLTTTNNGYINVTAGDDISIYGTFNGPVFESVQADGDMTLDAEDDLKALGNLTSNTGSIELYSSDNTTYLGGDVTAAVDVLLNNNTEFTSTDDQYVTAETGSITAKGYLEKLADGSLYLLANEDISLAGDVTVGHGGISIISETGKIFTPGGDDDTLNVNISGYSDHLEGIGVVLPKDYDQPAPDAAGEYEIGLAAIVIMSEEALNLGPAGTLTATGTYYTGEVDKDGKALVDDRPGVDFANYDRDGKPGGDPIDIAIYLASNSEEVVTDNGSAEANDYAGDVHVNSPVADLPDGAVMVVDAYDTVTFGDTFEGSLIDGNVDWLEVCSRISPTFEFAWFNDKLPKSVDELTGADKGWDLDKYVWRGEGGGDDGGAWVLKPVITADSRFPFIESTLEGCPQLVQAAATELGVTAETIQVGFGDSLALNPSIQACDSCAALVDAATVLRDADGSRMAAMVEAFNTLAPADAPFTPATAASIATAFEDAAVGTQYASAVGYIDAFVQYVAVLDTGLGSPVGDSVAFVMDKYGAGVSGSDNANIAAFVAIRLAAIGQ